MSLPLRFMHPGVRLLEFSPNERYLLTYSATDATGRVRRR
jgi:uncharacterized protein with WD repeat